MQIEITPELLAGLKEKAEKATPGSWFYGKDAESIGWQHPDSNRVYANLRNQNNTVYGILVTVNYHVKSCDQTASYIAAANPAVMLALIAKIEQLEKESDWFAERLVDNKILFDSSKVFSVKGYNDYANQKVNRAGHINLWRNAAKKTIKANGKSIT